MEKRKCVVEFWAIISSRQLFALENIPMNVLQREDLGRGLERWVVWMVREFQKHTDGFTFPRSLRLQSPRLLVRHVERFLSKNSSRLFCFLGKTWQQVTTAIQQLSKYLTIFITLWRFRRFLFQYSLKNAYNLLSFIPFPQFFRQADVLDYMK